jgi:serine/threonine protein kinase
VKTKDKRACPVCGTLFPDSSESCPVCALRGAVRNESAITESRVEPPHSASQLRFEHYEVLTREDGTPLELGRGAMGVTYKAIDVNLRCAVALKVINARFIGDESARRRFVREARAAASVRHPNVASVFHLGESGDNYFYVMEFVDGETLGKLIQRSGRLASAVAIEILAQVAAGLMAIEKQHLEAQVDNLHTLLPTLVPSDHDVACFHVSMDGERSCRRDNFDDGRFASPEQFAGIGIDIRSDLYSLGITFWETLSMLPRLSELHTGAMSITLKQSSAFVHGLIQRGWPDPICWTFLT